MGVGVVAADAKIPQDKVFFLIASSSSSSPPSKAPTRPAFALVVALAASPPSAMFLVHRLAHVLHTHLAVVSSSPAVAVRFLNAPLHSMHVSFAFLPMMMTTMLSLLFGRWSRRLLLCPRPRRPPIGGGREDDGRNVLDDDTTTNDAIVTFFFFVVVLGFLKVLLDAFVVRTLSSSVLCGIIGNDF